MPPPHNPPVTSVDQKLMEFFNKLHLIYFYWHSIIFHGHLVEGQAGNNFAVPSLICLASRVQ